MDGKFSIQPYLNDLDILNQTAEQVKKDLGFFSLDVKFSGRKENAYEELFNQVFPHVRQLMEREYEKFFSLLYRVDISEKQIHVAQNADPEAEVAKIISDLIIKRCLQKVVLRKLFS